MIVDHGERYIDIPDQPSTNATVVWLLGRGLSIECGLTWTVPEEWKQCERTERIEEITNALRIQMKATNVDTAPIDEFLTLLSQRTAPEWRHLFVTTNWDFLLQRELNAMLRGSNLPPWLHYGAGSHVHHVNGTVEVGTQDRSCFILEDDQGPGRTETTEANYAFGYMILQRTFVVVGMSFECGPDRYLLRQLSQVEDEMPIGESHWIIVNPNPEHLEAVCARIRSALPAAKVEGTSTFADWRRDGCPALRTKGVFRD